MIYKKLTLAFLICFYSILIFGCQDQDNNPIGNGDEKCNNLLLDEGFEGNIDERISFNIAGDFSMEPGVIESSHFGSQKAYSFGLSNCSVNCYDESEYDEQPFRCIIRIIFPENTYICKISLLWSESNGNWGSGGHVYADGEMITKYPDTYIGIAPPSNGKKDESVHKLVLDINKNVRMLDIAVWDISDGSQILVDDIKVFGE